MSNTLTKANRHTAVWGGGFPRTTFLNGKWLCVPTGHGVTALSLGTTAGAPDTSYNPSTTADDLGGVIWNSISTITISKCRIWYAQGGTANTTHILCLMRYDIDADGTLSNGAEVAGPDTDSGSDDYTTLAFTDLTMTADNTVTSSQVLIAMIYFADGINIAVTGKCIIEYTM
tara:strand:- start:92 stop:610 length:519 start_codon:yes stop_codon:yes gene_type:complete